MSLETLGKYQLDLPKKRLTLVSNRNNIFIVQTNWNLQIKVFVSMNLYMIFVLGNIMRGLYAKLFDFKDSIMKLNKVK